MSHLDFFCMSVTPFSKTGEVSEEVFHEFLDRMIDAKIGVFLGSGGAGEGHALTTAELHHVYRSAAAYCKGKIPVHANLPEQHTASATCEQAQIAIESGVEVVHLYTLEGRHGMRPTEMEVDAYLDAVLSAVNFPTAIAVSPSVLGYTPSADVIARACRKHLHVKTVRLHNVPDTYLIDLKSKIDRDMSYYFQFSCGNFNPLAVGVNALFAVEANVIPKTCRAFLDCYEQGDRDGMMRAFIDLRRLDQYNQKWLPGSARPLKMAIRALKLPGWEGGLRAPYLMPTDVEMELYARGLFALGIQEIVDHASNTAKR